AKERAHAIESAHIAALTLVRIGPHEFTGAVAVEGTDLPEARCNGGAWRRWRRSCYRLSFLRKTWGRGRTRSVSSEGMLTNCATPEAGRIADDQVWVTARDSVGPTFKEMVITDEFEFAPEEIDVVDTSIGGVHIKATAPRIINSVVDRV